MDEVARVIGTLEAGLEAQKEQHNALSARVDGMRAELNGKLDILLQRDAQHRGGRRMLGMITTGVASIVGAVAAMAVQWFTSGPSQH